MKTDLKFFATVTVAAAALIAGVAAVMLSGKDSNGGHTQTDADREYDAEVVMSHLNYDGLYLNGNTTLNCYDRTGKLKESDIPLDSVMRGGKCLALFSMNSCSDCSRLEMSLLSKLPCRDNIVFVFDYDMHSHMGNRKMPAGGFYEICKGKLCDGIEDEPQFPILFYTEGLRIVTSNVVSTTTLPFTRRFHNFISKKLSE